MASSQGVELNDDFTVRIRPAEKTNWVSVPAYLVNVDEVRGTKHHVEHAPWLPLTFRKRWRLR